MNREFPSKGAILPARNAMVAFWDYDLVGSGLTETNIGNSRIATSKLNSGITSLMFLALKASPTLLATAALLGLLSVPMTIGAEPSAPHPGHAAAVEVQFRGCESDGWCRFWIEPLHPLAESLHRVRPDGVSRMPGDDAISIAVRDRLNALLASMIHQSKRIVLHDLRELDDGTFAAAETVNGVTLASDPILLELCRKHSSTIR